MPPDPTIDPSAGPGRATLLVFTLDAAGERARRRLLPAGLGAWETALYRDCLHTALAAGRAAGCSLAVCAPRHLPLSEDVTQFEQHGSGFGDRLGRALGRFRPSATRPLLVVGSDTPGLTGRHLAEALARLADRPGQLVVGPSPDGGFYLLAAARPVEELLGEVRWLRSDTLESLRAAARARGIEISLLAPLADLDGAADLDAWLARGAARLSTWLRWLAAQLRGHRRPLATRRLGRPRRYSPARVPARGPPRRHA
jgi:glycosyltransferase A (GT-A) superfamily protein (DUF2064 family)